MTARKQPPKYTAASSIAGVRVELKYASTDNFTGKNLYGANAQCFMHEIAAEKLKKAVGYLRAEKPGLLFLIYDGLRPRSVQEKMWEHVKGTGSEKYVADPQIGSMHNLGLALDLTLCDGQGLALDMGAGFDDFREISEPRLEERFAASGQLQPAQLVNRKTLRNCMEKAGFIQLPHEWWHFDALPQNEAFQNFPMVD